MSQSLIDQTQDLFTIEIELTDIAVRNTETGLIESHEMELHVMKAKDPKVDELIRQLIAWIKPLMVNRRMTTESIITVVVAAAIAVTKADIPPSR